MSHFMKGICNLTYIATIIIVIDFNYSETKSIASILLNLKKALEKYLQEEPKSDESTLELKEGLEGYLDLNDGVIHLIKVYGSHDTGPIIIIFYLYLAECKNSK